MTSARGWIWPATASGPGNLTEPEAQASAPAYPGFVTSLKRVLRGTFRYGGRTRRTDLIVYAVTALWLVPLALSLGELIAGRDLPREADLGLGALLALPFVSLFVRRCHDSERTGTWVWLLLPELVLPLVRGIAGLSGGIGANLQLDRFIWPLDWLAIATNLGVVALCLIPGSAGTNRFGGDPRQES